MQDSNGKKQTTVLPSHDAYEAQQWPSGHVNPKDALVASYLCGNQQLSNRLNISKPSLVLEPSKQLNELLANKECWEVEKSFFFQGTAYKLIIQYQMVNPESCIRVSLYRLNKLCSEISGYTYQQLIKERLWIWKRGRKGMWEVWFEWNVWMIEWKWPQRLIGTDTIRKSGLVEVGEALLEEVCHWMQALRSQNFKPELAMYSLFLKPTDPDVQVLAHSPPPWLPAWHHASCHYNKELNLWNWKPAKCFLL